MGLYQNRSPLVDASALFVEGQGAAKFLFADFRPDVATRRGFGTVRGRYMAGSNFLDPLVC